MEIKKWVIVKAFYGTKEKELSKLYEQLQKKNAEVRQIDSGKRPELEETRGAVAEEVRGIQREIKKAENCLATLKTILDSDNQTVVPGSLVVLENGSKVIILVVNKKEVGCSGGCSALSATCGSIEAPLIKAILNKKAGDIVIYHDKTTSRDITYRIVEVQ